MSSESKSNRLKKCWNCPHRVDLQARYCPKCNAYKPGSPWSHFWAEHRMERIGDCQSCGTRILRKDSKKCPKCGRPEPIVSEQAKTRAEIIVGSIVLGMIVLLFVMCSN